MRSTTELHPHLGPLCFVSEGLQTHSILLNDFPVHRNSFVLLQPPVYGKREWEISSSVQKRFIPVHSTADVVKGILVIAKATSKPNVVNLRDQMSLACTHIIDHSPVWKMLQEMEF
uniref:Uncharacterized protein n=1 Tax=Cyprinus carpio carpio TaxID=630221 RepID=A0A9J7Y6U9_CYPCA